MGQTCCVLIFCFEWLLVQQRMLELHAAVTNRLYTAQEGIAESVSCEAVLSWNAQLMYTRGNLLPNSLPLVFPHRQVDLSSEGLE